MEITPFRGLELITSVNEESQVEALLDESGAIQLICDDCSGSSFLVKALIEADLVVSVAIPPLRQAALHDVNAKTVSIIKIKECANCGAKHYIKDTAYAREKEKAKNGKSNTAGASGP